MLAAGAAMSQDVLVDALGDHHRVSEDRQTVECAALEKQDQLVLIMAVAKKTV
jgi:hypothetical protein